MKHYKLVTYILLSSLIWISCDKDKTSPEIEFINPIEGSTFELNDILSVEFNATDNEELAEYTITLTDAQGTEQSKTNELQGTSQNVKEEFTLDFTSLGTLMVNITVHDAEGNTSTITRDFEYNNYISGSIDLNIKLEYNGQPLVIFNDYNYPDGKKMDFTRVSFYTSEMKLDETTINEVEFHNLTNTHSTVELANEGYSWKIENVQPGNYSELSFNIGVPPELNNMDPGSFPSGHPLAKPAENWFSWMSYIFLKIEGNIDFDDDEEAEFGIALHTGSNEALRRLSLDYPVEIKENEETKVNLIFDIYDLFDGPDGLFPIKEYPQIHSLTQLDGVIELSNNLNNSFKKS